MHEFLDQERLNRCGPYDASPVAGDGKIYAASARGVVTVLEASDKLNVFSRNDLGQRIMAPPAPVGGLVYLAHGSFRESSWHFWFVVN